MKATAIPNPDGDYALWLSKEEIGEVLTAINEAIGEKEEEELSLGNVQNVGLVMI